MFRLKLVPSAPSIQFLKYVPMAGGVSIAAVLASIALFFLVGLFRVVLGTFTSRGHVAKS